MDSLNSHDGNERTAVLCDFDAPPMVRFDERRMHVRAYAYWTSLLRDRPLPSIEDLNPEQIEDFGSHSILLDFTAGVSNPAIAFVGSALLDECGIDADIGYVANVPPRTLISRLTDHYLQIIANAAPIGFEAEFTNQRNVDIMYRGILMPFSSDGDTIDFIYGVINWKEVASDSLTESIAAEVDAMMRVMLAPQQGGDDLSHWHAPVADADPMPAPIPASMAAPAAPLYSDDDGPIAFRPLEDPGADVMDLGLSAFNADSAELADWLARAREHADQARQAEGRTHAALYQAIGATYDLTLAARHDPEGCAEMLADAGIAVQPRSPTTALVKLSFGIDYDKTRIAEYALVIDDALERRVSMGTLAEELGRHRGGLKALVASIRAVRRKLEPVKPRAESARRRAGARRPMSADAVVTAADGLAVVVARREADGTLSLIAALPVEDRLNDRVLARAMRGLR